MTSKPNNVFLKFIQKKNQKIFLFSLIIFSIYCSLILGKSWDEGAHLRIGKSTLDYLFSLGKIDNYTLYREHFSPIYWSLKYLLTQIFPHKYQIQVTHIINLFFSICTVVGIGKLCKEFFNQNVGKIVFLILFFYPVFFGHMSFNGKDMFLAFCHVWIFYLVVKYLKKQNDDNKRNNYIIFLAILAASATGLEMVFLGTVAPIVLFVFYEVYFSKKFISKSFDKKKLYLDLLKILFIFYFLLVLFWVDTHKNIFILPYNLFLEHLSLVAGELPRGRAFNLLNGEYHLSWQVPKLHFLINLLYKSPEYFLLCYAIFLFIFIKSNSFFKRKFQFFNYKLILMLSIMIIPFMIRFIIPIVVYDGMRHFLWVIPYFCIIPGLTIYYLIEHSNLIKFKLILASLLIFIFYYLFNFFTITPYQYTYLNFLNGKAENRYKKFENDYWAVSANELIKFYKFEKEKPLKIAICGVHPRIFEYFNEIGNFNVTHSNPSQADYIIMTNRATRISGELTVTSTNKTVKILNCFDIYKGEDISRIERNGVLLSVIRKKINRESWDKKTILQH